MDGIWTAAIVIAGIVIIVAIVIIGSVARTSAKTDARKRIALADAENGRRYQELVELCVTGQQQTVEELAKLTERVASIEELLKDVG